jgi:hypothetical protein
VNLGVEQVVEWTREVTMARWRAAVMVAVIVVISGAVGAGEAEHSSDVQPGPARGCEPSLPILAQRIPAVVQGNGIQDCDVIRSPTEWDTFCADNDVACDPYDDEFFREWAMVALVVHTVSPVICENAGEVPGWALSCLTRTGASIRARVELTLAGPDCWCSMNPQYPVRLVIVDAVRANRVTGCRAWPEVHRYECLRN